MSLHAPARWIVTYDITEPHRGTRVHRYLKGQGVPLQYSVFIVDPSAARMHQLLRELSQLIDPRADDLRAYRWPDDPEVHLLGRSLVPDDVLLGATGPATAPAPHKYTRSRA